jgi:hypothetical protein
MFNDDLQDKNVLLFYVGCDIMAKFRVKGAVVKIFREKMA